MEGGLRSNGTALLPHTVVARPTGKCRRSPLRLLRKRCEHAAYNMIKSIKQKGTKRARQEHLICLASLSLRSSQMSFLALACLNLSCLVLPCPVFPCLVFPCLVLSGLGWSGLVLFCPVFSCRVSFRLVLCCSVLSCRVMSRPVMS